MQKWMLVFVVAAVLAARCVAEEQSTSSSDRAALKTFVEANCIKCHDKTTRKGGLALDELLAKEIGPHAEAWEKVVRKLTARQMPPQRKPRPSEREYDAAIAALELSLDAAAAKSPNPGRTETFRRLNRAEYRNVI